MISFEVHVLLFSGDKEQLEQLNSETKKNADLVRSKLKCESLVLVVPKGAGPRGWMTRGAGLSGSPSCSPVFLQRCTATSRRMRTEPRRSTVSRGTRSAASAVCEPDWCLPGLMCGSLFSHQVCHLTRWFADIMRRHHAAQVAFREKCKAHIQRQLEIGESAPFVKESC